MFTDIEASTDKLSRLGGAYKELLLAHHAIIRESLAEYGGDGIDTAGDGFFCVFRSPTAGIAAVIQMQRHLGSHEWPHGERVRVRMGIHTGEASVDAAGVVGVDVHKAARIAAVGHGGQVLVSEVTAALVRHLLEEGVTLRDLGRHRLKDLAGPETLYQLEAPGLDKDFPPLLSLDNQELRHNLPTQFSRFVGREQELNAVTDILATSRLVTLIGPGGCGKTRLALQVAAGLLDGSADGVWFVDLAPLLDDDHVASTVMSVFRIREDPTRPIEETLFDALRDRRLLLVIDNCEHVIDTAAKLIDGALRVCPGVHVLATSREPLLLDGEHIYRVPSLSLKGISEDHPEDAHLSDAVQLFNDRALSHTSDFVLDEQTLPAVITICGHLDGMPLAIELAAARLRSLSLSDIEDRLGDRFSLLTGGARTALPRQRTLYATIDWSYELLNKRDRDLFERVSVFSGGFQLEAVEAVWSSAYEGFGEVIEALSSLVDKSLVQADKDEEGNIRYDLLETIRQFAAERLGSNTGGEAAVRTAHAQVFLELAESVRPLLEGQDHEKWARRLTTELDNLRLAASHFLRAGMTGQALRLAIALNRFWYLAGLLGEGLRLYEAALGCADAAEFPVLTTEAYGLAAHLSVELGKMEVATCYIERGTLLARACGHDAVVANFFRQAAWIYYGQGAQERASNAADESVAAARRSGIEREIAIALGFRAAISIASDPAAARVDLTETLALGERLGEPDFSTVSHANLGYLELQSGFLEQARHHFEEASRLSSMPARTASVKLNLATVAILEGDIGGAALLTGEVLALSHELGLNGLIASCLLAAAVCTSADGNPTSAAELHGAADALEEPTGRVWESVEGKIRLEDHARLRAAIGDDAFEEAYAAGKSLDAEGAVRLANRALASFLRSRR